MRLENSEIQAVENQLRTDIVIESIHSQGMSLDERMKLYKVPAVSLSVVNNYEVSWAKAYGTKTNSQGEPISVDNLFLAGSISKTVTAYGVLILVEQGKVNLDTNVNQYLKSWKVKDNEFTATEKVTLRRLLSHTAGTSVSGFPGYSAGEPIPSTLDILRGDDTTVNTDPVEVIFKPGSKFQYSGGGTTIVQLLIEEITGETFQDWMWVNVLEPIGMHASTFQQPSKVEQNTLGVYGHTSKGPLEDGPWHLYPEKAAAGLWTTPSDLAKFMLALLNGLKGDNKYPLGPDLVKEMVSEQGKINDKMGVGLGVFLARHDDTLTFSHDGGDEGFIARFKAYPNTGSGMVIMVNNHNAWGLIDEIDNSISDVYKIPSREKTFKTIIEEDIRQYPYFSGRYFNDSNEWFVIKIIDNKFHISFDESVWHRLYLDNQSNWFAAENNMVLVYISEEGKFTAKFPENAFRGALNEDFIKVQSK